MMTQKDFVAIAAALNEQQAELTALHGAQCTQRQTLCVTALKLCDVMEEANPRFDKRRFLTAAGFIAPEVYR